jgi:protein O-mannosyl-transferase
VPFLLLSAAASVVTLWSRKSDGAVVAAIELPSLATRLATACVAYLHYVLKMIWPTDLGLGYPAEALSVWEIAAAITFLGLMTALVVRLISSHSYLAMGWFWFLGTLVPVIGIVQVGSNVIADRFTYVPLTGLFLMIAWGSYDLLRVPQRRLILGAAAAVLIGLCVLLTQRQVAHWKNSERLAEQTLRLSRKNPLILTILANVRIDQGRFDEAIMLLSEALEINPRLVEGLDTLGNALQKVGRYEEAMMAFTEALELDPTNAKEQNNLAKVQNNFGFFLTEQNRLDEAIPHLTAALKSRPEFPEALYNLGNVWFTKGNISEAISHYEKAVRLSPAYADAQCNLGMALLKAGKAESALPHVEAAIRLKPDFARAHHHLSEILFQLGRFPESEAEARRAVQLEPEQPLMQYQLALALDAQKKWPEAEAIFSQVLETAQRAGDRRLSEEITQHLSRSRSQ